MGFWWFKSGEMPLRTAIGARRDRLPRAPQPVLYAGSEHVKEVKQDDDRDRDAKQPGSNAFHGDLLSRLVSVEEETRKSPVSSVFFAPGCTMVQNATGLAG